MPKQNYVLKETKIDSELICLNYAKVDVKINPDKIPNTIPQDYLKEWQKDDPNPYSQPIHHLTKLLNLS